MLVDTFDYLIVLSAGCNDVAANSSLQSDRMQDLVDRFARNEPRRLHELLGLRWCRCSSQGCEDSSRCVKRMNHVVCAHAVVVAVVTTMSALSAITTGFWSRRGDKSGRKPILSAFLIGALLMCVVSFHMQSGHLIHSQGGSIRLRYGSRLRVWPIWREVHSRGADP